MKYLFSSFIFFLFLVTGQAQKDFYSHVHFTEADTLRGMLRPERTCYDVRYYDLDIKFNIKEKFIEGYNDIHFEVKENFNRLQIDLYENMKIKEIIFESKPLEYERIHNAVFINFPTQQKGNIGKFRVYYEGKPTVADNAPWDGGFVWASDNKNNPWVGVACEGAGASLWWPNKDHLSDEPDSMAIHLTVPRDLLAVSNGNLRSQELIDDTHIRYDWFVSYPINNYNVTVNIAQYVHFNEEYKAEDGEILQLDYYVLPSNLEKAKKQFAQVGQVLSCFEHYFGKYPFWNDGFALVETPYLGMEHQGAIAYGNGYMRGYRGGMIPRDMNWDYIIVHETGHEYWGNSISCNDHAEMWIHEAFTTYMEALFVECSAGYEDYVRYLNHFRHNIYIANLEPILGPMNVNWEDWKSSDHYVKGSWILHTLRHSLQDDERWFGLLKSFHEKYARTNIKSEDFIQYASSYTGKNLDAFFEQYLEYPSVPTFVYNIQKKGNSIKLSYKWEASIDNFDMPVLVGKKGAYELIYPTKEWKTIKIKNCTPEEFAVATELFLIDTKEN